MGLFEPGVNLEKEQKMLEKHNPYECVRSWFIYTYDRGFYWETHFRIAEKGIVFYQATESGIDLRIPWDNIVDVGWNDIFVYQLECPGLIMDLSDGRTIHVRFDIGWTGRRDTIHWLRGVSRIIQSNIGNDVNLDK